MRTRLRKWSLWLGAAAFLTLPLASWAQLSTFDIETRIGAESHVGNITGHAKDAKADYRRYCVGCHGDLGDGNGENFRLGRPQAPRFPIGRVQVPVHSDRNLAYG